MTSSTACLTRRIQEAVDFAWQNPQSSWYRDFCKRKNVSHRPIVATQDDITQLPIIEREDLSEIGLLERAFTDIGLANEMRSTSGTSGREPLFYLRDGFFCALATRLYRDGARRRILFWNYHLASSCVEGDRLCGLQTIVSDPRQLEKNVALVKQLAIDTLAGTPSLLLIFGHLLNAAGENRKIRFLDFQGEPSRPQTVAALKTLYPNASHYSAFSIGEIGGEIGIRTALCNDQHSGYYHVNTKDVYVESVEDKLVVTKLTTPTVMPLIRYRTGDDAEWIRRDQCDCGHDGLSFKLLGRSNVDFVRIAGVELRNDAIAEVIDQFAEELTCFVATEVKDQVNNNAQIITMNVSVVPLAFDTARRSDLEQRLQKALMNSLRVSSTTMLHEMVTAGFFAPPKIIFLDKQPVTNKKLGIKLVST